jgi:hypothetical protein
VRIASQGAAPGGPHIAAPTGSKAAGAAAEGASSGAALRILGNARPSSAGAALTAARASATAELTADRAKLAHKPPAMRAPSGLKGVARRTAKDAKTAAETPDKPKAIDAQDGEGREPAPPETDHIEATAPVPEGPAPDQVSEAPEDPVARGALYRTMIWQMPATDDSVRTDPGAADAVALTGAADPGRLNRQAASNEAGFAIRTAIATRGMAEDEGENDIFPTLPEETLTAPVAPGTSKIGRGAAGAAPMLGPQMSKAFDAGMSDRWAAGNAEERSKHDAAMKKRMGDEARERAATDKRIAELEAGATAEQLGHRRTAGAAVAAARAGWQDELAGARKTYDGEKGRVETGLDRDVKARVKTAENDASRHLETGRRRAEARRREAETEAARRRREAERKRKKADGFLNWLSSKVKSFFHALRKGLKMLFNAMRKAVKLIIEGAKKLAAAAIELGRRAVIGMIRIAGKGLELAADVFLAAFPRARARAKALIRKGVATAEEGVNRAARALRKAVFAALDLLGKALAAIIDAFEAVYLAVLKAIEFLVLGFIEVMRAMYRLDLAARNAPAEIEGQVYEEMIGADLTTPLAFEVTLAELTQWEARKTAMPAAAGGDTAAAQTEGPARATGGLPAEIVVDPVVDFEPDPELESALDLADGEAREFGETSDPASTYGAEFTGAGGGSTAEGDHAATDAPGADTASDLDLASSGPGSAIAGSTTDEKLDTLIAQQKPPATCRKETPTKQEGPPLPLSAKIGPLTKSQRAKYMLSQAWQGIKHWAKCNWPLILLGIIAALLVIVAVVAAVVLSGGTVGAALGGLLAVFTGAMLLYAIARIGGFLLDYLKKSIGGDVVGGSKALARAFAVAAVEVVFAILTYLTAGVFRVAAAGIKGAGRLASSALKTAFKLTTRGGQAVGRGLRRVGGALARGSGQVGSAVLRRGKLIIRGTKSGFAKGAKSLRQLGRRLGKRFRFRRFKIERKGRWLRLLGLINPWVLLASGEIRQVDDLGKVEKGKYVKLPGEAEPGLVIGLKTRAGGGKGSPTAQRFSSRAVARRRRANYERRKAFYEKHKNKTPSEVREALEAGKETSRNSKILAGRMKNNPHPGRPAHSPGDAAHHLVPSTDARGKVARAILKKFGIDINDPANGLFLNAKTHAKVHTNAGYQKINKMLAGAKTKKQALDKLDDIANAILGGTFP